MAERLTDEIGSDCLLVVDDQEANIQVLGAMLGKLGFEIVPATDVTEALNRLAARRPDLILLDLLLPTLDGFDLCRRIQENPAWADIPIIFLSDSDDKALVVKALESGGVDYITKPFNKLELVSRVRTQLMLKTARDHLRKLAQDKEELLGMISHHLQNHFAGIEMSAQVLLNRVATDDKSHTRLLVEIKNASSRMRGFVKSFLANSEAEHRLVIKMENVNLADAAGHIARQYEGAADAKGIALRLHVGKEMASVRADVTALMQVLDNLVSNAIKFSPSGKEVRLAVIPNEAYLECHVQDQGAGFTKEDKAAMFGRYARLSTRPTGGEPSTGLGLSIAKKLTQAMGGELMCESEHGKGTTFILRLARASVRERAGTS
jgi:two-component system, sensor histidine kinase and response regulator